jgi:hypothetical protein
VGLLLLMMMSWRRKINASSRLETIVSQSVSQSSKNVLRHVIQDLPSFKYICSCSPFTLSPPEQAIPAATAGAAGLRWCQVPITQISLFTPLASLDGNIMNNDDVEMSHITNHRAIDRAGIGSRLGNPKSGLFIMSLSVLSHAY